MSKKQTAQSRRTARRKARQERAMDGFRKWHAEQPRPAAMSQGQLRGFLFTTGVPLQNLPQRSKQRIVEDFG